MFGGDFDQRITRFDDVSVIWTERIYGNLHKEQHFADEAPPSNLPCRSGNAWVNYSDGHLFKVSTKDAKCTKVYFFAFFVTFVVINVFVS